MHSWGFTCGVFRILGFYIPESLRCLGSPTSDLELHSHWGVYILGGLRWKNRHVHLQGSEHQQKQDLLYQPSLGLCVLNVVEVLYENSFNMLPPGLENYSGIYNPVGLRPWGLQS